MSKATKTMKATHVNMTTGKVTVVKNATNWLDAFDAAAKEARKAQRNA